MTKHFCSFALFIFVSLSTIFYDRNSSYLF